MGDISMTLINALGLLAIVVLMAAVVYWISQRVIAWVTMPEWTDEALTRASKAPVEATSDFRDRGRSYQRAPGIVAVVIVLAFAGAWQALTASETLSTVLLQKMAEFNLLEAPASVRLRPNAETMESQLKIVRELEDQLRKLSMRSATMSPRSTAGTGGDASFCAPRNDGDGFIVSCSQLISKSSPQLRAQILREWKFAP